MYQNIDFFYKVKINHLEYLNFKDIFKLDFRQLKLLFCMFSFLNHELKDEYLIKSIDINNSLGYSNNYKILYRDLITLSKIRLENKIVFKHIKFDSKMGLISFQIKSEYKNTFKNIKANFIVFELKNIIRLKYDFSIILYCLLLQYKNIKYREIDVKTLYKFANVDEDYDISRFIRNKLKKQINEINKFSDLYIKYKKITCNRFVVSIYFNIYHNKYRVELDEQIKMIYNYIKINYNFNVDLLKIEHFIESDNFYTVYNKCVKFKPHQNKNNLKLFYEYILS